MLKLNTTHTTPHGLDVQGTVWRWRGLQIDATGTIVVTLLAFGSKELADLMGAGQEAGERQPLDEGRLVIERQDFLAVAGANPPGNNLAERISYAIYAHARAKVPTFADAEDV